MAAMDWMIAGIDLMGIVGMTMVMSVMARRSINTATVELQRQGH
ncbi:hypothetical protein [Caballeronia terrestris]|nr:hypothetical protein [Caballeronia terrestris]